MVALTVYRNARDPAPVDVIDWPWSDVAQALAATANEPTGAPETASPEEQKKHLISFSPHRLAPGTTRALENVELVSLLVIDVDHGPAPEVVIERMHTLGIAGLLYESPTATVEHPKYRIVSPVAAPIRPENCRETRLRFAAMLGLAPDCGVKGAIDASKLFFAGRLHGTPERRTAIIDGQPVDTSALPPCPSAEWYTAPALPKSALLHDVRNLPISAGIAAALGPWTAHAGRKWSVCGAVGGMMRKLGYTAAQCEAEIRAWLPPDDPSVDVEAGVTWALGAWAKPAEDVSGRAELARFVGEDHARVIADAARAGTPWGRMESAAPRPLRQEWAHPVTAPGDDPLGERLKFDTPDEPICYAVEALRLAPSRGKVSMFGGLAGAGKGPLFDYVHVCIALGVPLFGAWPVTQSEVLIADFEGARLTKHRMYRIVRALGFEPQRLDERLDLRDCSRVDAMSDAFLKALEAHSAPVIGLDSYTSAMLRYDVDQNKNEFARLGQCLGSLGRTVSCVTHARKPGGGSEKFDAPTLADISGSGALGALAQTGISIYKPDPADMSRITVGCMRAPETGFATFDVIFRDLADGSLSLELVTAEQREREVSTRDTDAQTQRVRRVLEFMRREPEPHKIGKDFTIADVTGAPIGTNTMGAILNMLTEAGLVTRTPSTRGTTYQIVSVHDPRPVRAAGGVVLVG